MHILTCLLYIRLKELRSCGEQLLIYIEVCGFGFFSCSSHLFSSSSWFLFGLDTQKIIDSFLCHFDVEGLIHIVNAELVIVVDNAVFREHFDLGSSVILRLNLEQLSVTLVLCGIDTVYLLYRDLLTIDKVIGFTILCASFRNDLKLENIVTPIYGFLHRSSVDEILLEGGCYNASIVVHVECTSRGDTTNQVAAFGLHRTIRLNLNVIVYVLLCDQSYAVLLKLKACPGLPLIHDCQHFLVLVFVELDHDTIGVELDDYQILHVLIKVLSHFQEEKLTCDTYRTSHQRVKKVVVLVQHCAVCRVHNELECICCSLISGGFGFHTLFEYVFKDLRGRNVSRGVPTNRHEVRVITRYVKVSDYSFSLSHESPSFHK